MGVNRESDSKKEVIHSPQVASSRENENRPTVLMLAGNNNNSKNYIPDMCEIHSSNQDVSNAKVIVVRNSLPDNDELSMSHPEDNQKWLGALALMELAKNQEEAAKAALGYPKDSYEIASSFAHY